jgi:hypothetical protein
MEGTTKAADIFAKPWYKCQGRQIQKPEPGNISANYVSIECNSLGFCLIYGQFWKDVEANEIIFEPMFHAPLTEHEAGDYYEWEAGNIEIDPFQLMDLGVTFHQLKYLRLLSAQAGNEASN